MCGNGHINCTFLFQRNTLEIIFFFSAERVFKQNFTAQRVVEVNIPAIFIVSLLSATSLDRPIHKQ